MVRFHNQLREYLDCFVLCVNRKIVLFCLLVFSTLSIIAQSSQEELFEKANMAYNEENYTGAIELYKQILEQKFHSPEVYYNLANSYYRMGVIGESVYYYEKAKQLSPDNDKIINNSAFAANMTLDVVEKVPKTQIEELRVKLLNLWSLNQWAFLSIGISWIFAIIFILYFYSHTVIRKKIFFVSSMVVFGCLMIVFSLSKQKYSYEETVLKGVVFEKETTIWAEPNKKSEAVFFLHEGAVIEVVDSLLEWRKIKLENGLEGWTNKEYFRLIK